MGNVYLASCLNLPLRILYKRDPSSFAALANATALRLFWTDCRLLEVVVAAERGERVGEAKRRGSRASLASNGKDRKPFVER